MKNSIQVNKNIEDYKPDFWKGLSFRECIFSAATVFIGGSVVLFCNRICGISLTVSTYIAIPFSIPVALSGFKKVNGMYFFEIVKRYLKVTFSKPLPYIMLEKQKEEKPKKGKREKPQKRKGEK